MSEPPRPPPPPPPPRPPWDPIRATFCLVASILGFQCFVILLGVAGCLYWSGEIAHGRATCAAREQLIELLAQALAAALAFAAGNSRKP